MNEVLPRRIVPVKEVSRGNVDVQIHSKKKSMANLILRGLSKATEAKERNK